jgi:hypothetical protein
MTDRFADAENTLFELIDEQVENILGEAFDFYQRLLNKTDQELDDGNLPKEEVLEGLEYLKKAVKTADD